MNNKLPVIGPNILPPLGEFSVRSVPTQLIGYLKAHGYDDAEPAKLAKDSISVTFYGFNYIGTATTYKRQIPATWRDVRDFLGYPD